MKIAVVGGGISGLGAAWLLSGRHEVSVFECADRLGGHSNTVDVTLDRDTIPVDTGFIVYNEHNYPNLTRLFEALGVDTVASDMSFAVSLDGGSFEYFGSPRGLFAQPSNMVRPAFWGFLCELMRFYRDTPQLALRDDLDRLTLGELLAQYGYSDIFAHRHVLPMAAAIWSSRIGDILDLPASTFVQFFTNHGLLSLGERPQWRSVLGGSRNYVDKICAPFADNVHLSTSVVAVSRTPAGVILRDSAGQEHRFDELVMATHADQALEILGDQASDQERRVLGAFRYQRNRAVLHGDRALMPKRRRVWASWNYLAQSESGTTQRVTVSYWMNRLQKLETMQDIFVTLNPLDEPAPHLTHGEFSYDHPIFDRPALDAQTWLPIIQGHEHTWYCGSYCGYGFHEDGLQAGLAVASALGEAAPWQDEVMPMSPAWRTAPHTVPAIAAE